MLMQMAGVFLFWWLLVLAIGVAVVLIAQKYMLQRRKGRPKVPFAFMIGEAPSDAEPAEEPPATMASAGACAQRSRPLFVAPLPEPRRYLIGRGPVDSDEKA